MKHISQLVLEYFDSIPIGEFGTRKELINYVNSVNPIRSSYSSIDCYKRTLQLNNIISEPSDGMLGCYMKINEIPKGVSFNELRKRAYNNPYYGRGASVFDFVK